MRGLHSCSPISNTVTFLAEKTSLGEEVASILRLSLTPAELDHQLAVIKDKVLVSSAVVRRAATEYEQPARELGQRLFEALIADDVRILYVDSRRRAREDGCVLRLVLRVHPPELARLPWEFLFDPGRQDYVGLTMPLVRDLQVLAPRSPLRVAAPLRILGMVARPGDQHALDAGQEQQLLQDALAGLQSPIPRRAPRRERFGSRHGGCPAPPRGCATCTWTSHPGQSTSGSVTGQCPPGDAVAAGGRAVLLERILALAERGVELHGRDPRRARSRHDRPTAVRPRNPPARAGRMQEPSSSRFAARAAR